MKAGACRTKLSHLPTRLLPILLGVLAVSGLLLMAQPASAVSGQTTPDTVCMQTVFSGHTAEPVPNSDKLNCTANDIRLSRALSVSPNTCTSGTHFTLTATFETIVTANARYDAAFFFNTAGGANARLGTCSLSRLAAPPPTNSPVLQLDGDTCGDLNAGTYPDPVDGNPPGLTFTIPNVLCQDSDGDGFLNLPNCTSWHSNQGTVCSINATINANAPTPSFAPDTKSKCVCDDTFQVPVTVEEAEITVVKSASPATVPETGGAVTYTVQVTNDSLVESVTISSIQDDLYGDLGAISACGVGEPNATTPDACTFDSNFSCPDLIGVVLAPSGSATCKFQAFVSGDFGTTVTDTVEVCGTQTPNNAAVCDDDDADVGIENVSATPTLAKTAQSAANCQLDATYQVVVSNQSAIDTLTLSTLTDNKFGNIAATHAANTDCGVLATCEQVVSTSCGQASPGPGTLPATIAQSGNYTCQFVGKIVSTSCSFTHTDRVTGGVTDDDGVQSSPSGSASVTVTTTIP